jgi:hypothetical protein
VFFGDIGSRCIEKSAHIFSFLQRQGNFFALKTNLILNDSAYSSLQLRLKSIAQSSVNQLNTAKIADIFVANVGLITKIF